MSKHVYGKHSGKTRGRHTKRNNWLSIFAEILKNNTTPLTFQQIMNITFDENPDASRINITSASWGRYVKKVDEIETTIKNTKKEMIIDGKVLTTHSKTAHYRWSPCEHLDYTDTLTGAVCNDCGVEKEMVI